MNDIEKISFREMTIAEVAKALSVDMSTVRRYIEKVFPGRLKSGIKTWLNEEEVTLIKLKLQENQHLVRPAELPKTDLEKKLLVKQAMDILNEEIEELKGQVESQSLQLEEAKPKIEFHDQLETTKDVIPIAEYANLLSKRGFDIGEKRLFKFFYEKNYLITRIRPFQKCLENKWMEVKEYTYIDRNEQERIGRRVFITGKGQTYFTGIVKGHFTQKPVQTSF